MSLKALRSTMAMMTTRKPQISPTMSENVMCFHSLKRIALARITKLVNILERYGQKINRNKH